MSSNSVTVNPDLALERAGGDQGLARELFSMFNREIEDYREGLQLLYERGEHQPLYDLVHKIHGATKYLGIPATNEAALRFETRLKQSDRVEESDSQLLAQLLTALEEVQHAQLQFDL